MDDQTLQFVLFLGIAAALYTLVTVGFEIARRFVSQSQAAHPAPMPVTVDIAHPRVD